MVSGCRGGGGWPTAAVDPGTHAASAIDGSVWLGSSKRNGNGTSVSWRALSWMAILLVGAAVWALLDRQRTTAAMLIVAAIGVAIVPAMLQPMLDVLFWPLAVAIILIVAMGVAWVAGRTLEHWRQARDG